MKKSLKLFAATIAVSATSMAVKNVDAQVIGDDSSTDVWTQRSVVEVSNSINKEIEETGKYTIQWGDTLSVVAEAMGLSVDEITVLNQIENPDLIVAGSTLAFDNDNHLITFENEASGESVTYSTETGEEVEEAVVVEETSTDGLVYNNVEEWIQTEEVEAFVEETDALVYETAEVTYPENLITWDNTEAVATEELVIEEVTFEEEAVVEAPVVEEEVAVEEEVVEEAAFETDLTVEEDAAAWEVVEEVPAVEEVIEEPVYEEPVYEEIVEEPVYEEPVYEEVVETPSTGSIDYYSASLAEMPENAGLSEAELAAKLEIRRRESTHNYDVYSVSGNHYGAYQMLDSYFTTYGYGDTSPASQEAASNGYVASRYGSWQAALAHHNANNWY